ncbi:hypothetical protein H6G17_18085 [Chroococcidiopsis sp. FACHB-1243]|uniref:hypothetical protein n=1 Tax=Chroococcidiopsis sp. [FACHB-1243] TaxID=2692781 RepID=UPI00177F5FC5|nr:hypothetical protein [Chroococcidiopsis sp. [FACHB-1243]]MBD2307391.1 hypothetical protein [Chroococcidiopsis sp. [FACHB-1243]]
MDTAWFFRTFYYALVSQTHTCLSHYPALQQAVAFVNGNDRVTADVGNASRPDLSDFSDPALQQ